VIIRVRIVTWNRGNRMIRLRAKDGDQHLLAHAFGQGQFEWCRLGRDPAYLLGGMNQNNSWRVDAHGILQSGTLDHREGLSECDRSPLVTQEEQIAHPFVRAITDVSAQPDPLARRIEDIDGGAGGQEYLFPQPDPDEITLPLVLDD
jgi:hypothetical protein